VHELANGEEDGGDGFMVGGELFIESGLDLRESAGELRGRILRPVQCLCLGRLCE
jgi:hypothetical protein